jgi:UDP-N-acetylglucosamine--N-acetylmuramyl-(pentapeptide) pyrophosphoryl-undecaprenol N-acetylglucosamine transferase
MATLRTVSFPGTEDRLPAPTYVTGTPIRDLEGGDAATARARLGLPHDVPVMLIFGGSQAVRRLSAAVTDSIADLVERCCVVHITGAAGIAAAETLRGSLPPERQERYRPFAFLHEDMDAALVAADLLVGRAGSSTLAEAAAAGLPMIVVPYPHAAAHQKANAAEMVEAGAAILVDDEHFDGGTLREAGELLLDDKLAEMAAAARRVGRPGAAAAAAHLLEILVAREPLPSQDELDALIRTPATS